MKDGCCRKQADCYELPAVSFRRGETPLIRGFSSRAAQIGDGERDDLGGGAQVRKPQVLVGIVRVGLEDRTRPGAVEHDWYAGPRVMAGIGIERHPRHRHVEIGRASSRERTESSADAATPGDRE